MDFIFLHIHGSLVVFPDGFKETSQYFTSNIWDYVVHRVQWNCSSWVLNSSVGTLLPLSAWVQTDVMSECSSARAESHLNAMNSSRVKLLSSMLRQISRFERTLIQVCHNIQKLLYSLITVASSKSSENWSLFVFCFWICTVSRKLQTLPSVYLRFPICKRGERGGTLNKIGFWKWLRTVHTKQIIKNKNRFYQNVLIFSF